MRKRTNLIIFLLLLLPLTGCGGESAADVSTPTAVPTAVIAPEVLEAIETLEPVLTAVPESAAVEEESESIIQTREPKPTATPGLLATEIERRFNQPKAAAFLGLQAADWVNLLISLILVAVSYLLGTWLIYWLLARFVRRSQRMLDDKLYEAVRSDLRWLVVILTLRFATIRLAFLDARVKVTLQDLYFVLFVLIAVHITWRLLGVLEEWYRAQSVEMNNEA